MNEYLQEVETALNNRLYIVALECCLMIPDICGAIESNNGVATKENYEKWYNRYAVPKIKCSLTFDDCYLFRCSMAHQGTTIPHPRHSQQASYSRILFVVFDNNNSFMHNNILNGALNIDIKVFCTGIIQAAREWMKEMDDSNNQNFKTNSQKIIRCYPKGVLPYTYGVLTIT